MNLIIGFLIAGIAFLLAEIVIPGGVIGLIGVLCIATSIILGFIESVELGVTLLVTAFVLGIAGLWAWIKFFPDSKLGKEIFLDKNAKDWQGYEEKNKTLLDKEGVAHTQLRPSGVALIDAGRFDVVTQGELIDKGTAIRVIRIEGNRIVVAPLS